MGKFRRVFILRDSKQWEEISFEELKIGDIFRLYEPNGYIVTNEKKEEVFCAKSLPFFCYEWEAWMVETE